ncbi:MAG: glycosyltransferase family 39 protein [Planctomycetota bacterium]
MKVLAGTHRNVIVVIAITVVCLIPFVNKAFHIDDPLFIWSAKHILQAPADFYGFNVNWYYSPMPVSDIAKNPPLACYYTALVGWLFGFSEAAIHLGFLFWAAAAAAGIYYLSAEFCPRPLLAALAGILTPVFILSATTAMCDVMMLALWVWSMFLWIRGIERENRLMLTAASILAAACALTKYYGICLLPLLALCPLWQKRRAGMWLVYFLVPLFILACYQWYTFARYGRGLLLDAAAYAMRFQGLGNRQGKQLITGLSFTGGCVFVVFFYMPFLWSRRTCIGWMVVIVILIKLLLCLQRIHGIDIHSGGQIRWLLVIQLAVFVTGGLSIVALACVELCERRDAQSVLLFLWVGGTFVFASFVNWTVSGRSILPMAPAVGILLARRIDEHFAGIRVLKRGRIIYPLIPAAALALMVSYADYRLANSVRCAAAQIHKQFAATDRTLWFQGHWGFQYYMEEAGAKALNRAGTDLGLSDLIIIPLNNTNIYSMPQDVFEVRQTLNLSPYRFVTTMSIRTGSGFYADIFGPLPFALNTGHNETFLITGIRKQHR